MTAQLILWEPFHSPDTVSWASPGLSGLVDGAFAIASAAIDNTSSLLTDATFQLVLAAPITVGTVDPRIDLWALEAEDGVTFDTPNLAAAAAKSMLLGSALPAVGSTISNLVIRRARPRPVKFILMLGNRLGVALPVGTNTAKVYRFELQSTTTPPTLPAAPAQLTSFVSTAQTQNTITVSWAAGSGGGAASSWYMTYTDATHSTETLVPGSFNATGGIGTGFPSADSVTLRAYASNAGGTSTAATTTTQTTGTGGLLQPLTAVTYSHFTPNNNMNMLGAFANFGIAIPTGGLGAIKWTMMTPSLPQGQLAIHPQTGAVGAYALFAGTYAVTITGTDGLGNSASTNVTLTASNTGFILFQGNNGQYDPRLFYTDNAGATNDLINQFMYIQASDPSWTGSTTTITVNDPSGHAVFSQYSTGTGSGAGTLYMTGKGWPPALGSYPMTLTATNNAAGAATFTYTMTVVVAAEGGPVKQIEWVAAPIGSAAVPGMIAGNLYGHSLFNDVSWQLTDDAGGSLRVTVDGQLQVAGSLSVGNVPFTAEISDGKAPLSYSQSFVLPVSAGTTLPSSDLTVNFTSGLTNVPPSGTVATLSIAGISSPQWLMFGDGTVTDASFFSTTKFVLTPSGTTATITHQKPLSASDNCYGVDQSDQLTLIVTDGINVCTKTVAVPVSWPLDRATISIGPGKQFPDWDTFFFGNEYRNNWPNAGALVFVYSDPTNYLNGMFLGSGNNRTGGLFAPYEIVAWPGSAQRVRVNCANAAINGNGKYAIGTNGYDFRIQGFELFNYYTNVGDTTTTDCVGGETPGSGNYRIHDDWFHGNSVGAGRIAGAKAFTTLTCSERGGQTSYGNSHNWYFQQVSYGYFHTCLFMNTSGGHEFKSRGFKHDIYSSRFITGEMGDGSFQVNFPEGGDVYMQDCLLWKGPNSELANGTGSIAQLEAAGGDVYTDWAPSHSFTGVTNTFVLITVPSIAQTGQYPYAVYSWGIPPGKLSGKPNNITLTNNKYYGYPADHHMILQNGATGSETGAINLADPPDPDVTLPTRILATTGSQPAANQLQFPVPVLAEIFDPVDVLGTTGHFTSPGTWLTAIDQVTGITTMNINSLSSVPSGTSIQLGFGMAGCSLDDRYQSPNTALAAIVSNGSGVADNDNGPQLVLSRRQQFLSMPLSTPIGTALFNPVPSWYPGMTNVTNPNFVLSAVPGNRWAISNAATPQIVSTAALVQGVDVMLLTETVSTWFTYLFVRVPGSGIAAPAQLTSFRATAESVSTITVSWVDDGTGTSWSMTYTDATHPTETAVPGSFNATGGIGTGFASGDSVTLRAYAHNSGGTSPAATTTATTATGTSSPLLLHAGSRYLLDPTGKAVLQVGWHTWTNNQDILAGSGADHENALNAFDFTTYLARMNALGHNFIRFWKWDSYIDGGAARGLVTPNVYVQVSAGRFDLNQLNQAYFDHVRARVIQAAAAGIYVGVMLFEGDSVSAPNTGWPFHPFNININVNGVNGDPTGSGNGSFIFTATSGTIWNYQVAYVDKMIATCADLSNVLWEVGNEIPGSDATYAWQSAIVSHIHTQEEAIGALLHPVGIKPTNNPSYATTFGYAAELAKLVASTADFICRPGGHNQTNDIADAPGGKPVIHDTDAYYGTGGDWVWAVQAMMRGGAQVLYMDDMEGDSSGLYSGTLQLNLGSGFIANAQSARLVMGYALAGLALVPLENMVPSDTTCSTGYCLQDPSGGHYVGFTNSGAAFTMNLSGHSGTLTVRWVDLSDGAISSAGTTPTGSTITFTPPRSPDGWLLILTP